jgi:hypothetical protein
MAELVVWPNRPAPFQWGSCYSILSFICMFCWSLFVLSFFFFFFLAIVLSVLLGYTDSDYPFGVFKLFLLSNLFCRSVNVIWSRSLCIPYAPWCFSKLPSTIYAKAVGYAHVGMHHIRTKLFSLPLSKLHFLYNSCLENHVTNAN